MLNMSLTAECGPFDFYLTDLNSLGGIIPRATLLLEILIIICRNSLAGFGESILSKQT